MNVLPALIMDYFNDDNFQITIDYNSLRTHCLIKLINNYLNKDLDIEIYLDMCNHGVIYISYNLADKISQKLNIRHVEELFEDMVILATNILDDYLTNKVNYLTEKGELVNCNCCGKILLPPNKQYYYSICKYCGLIRVFNEGTFFDDEVKICYGCENICDYIEVPIGYRANINKNDGTIAIEVDDNIYRFINNDNF